MTADAAAASAYTLLGLLLCAGCDRPLHPMLSADGQRCYQSACGCRLRPVPAAATERLTFDALRQRNRVHRAEADVAQWRRLYRRELVAVRVGAEPGELTFVLRN